MTTMQGSVESDFSAELAYRDHPVGSVNPIAPFNVPLQPCIHPPSRGILPIENPASHPHGSSSAEGAALGTEDRTYERGSSSVSDVYSQGYIYAIYFIFALVINLFVHLSFYNNLVFLPYPFNLCLCRQVRSCS